MTLLKDIIIRCIEAINALEEVTRQNEKEIKEVYGENQKLRDSIRQLDMRSKCSYCGEVIDERPYEKRFDPEIAEKCKQHLVACKKSPSYQLRQLVDVLEKQNKVLISERDEYQTQATQYRERLAKWETL